jgi:hypothetical protein
MEKQKIIDIAEKYDSLCAQIFNSLGRNNRIYYVEMNRRLEDGDAGFININDRIRQFIFEESLSFYLRPEQVKRIDSGNIEVLQKRVREEEEVLRRQVEEQQTRSSELERQALKLKDEEAWLKFMVAFEDTVTIDANGNRQSACVVQ